MSTSHSGNIQNEVTLEEHDGTNYAKRVNVVAGGAGNGAILDGVDTNIKATVISTASGLALMSYPLSGPTIYAVVNTGAAGVQNSMVTINQGPNFIGLATVVQGTAPWQSLATLYPSSSYIGLATIDIGTQNKIALVGNITLTDPKTYIGLTTVTPASAWPDPKTYIGLATVSNAVAWPDPKGYIGLVTVTQASTTRSLAGNVTISDSKGFIGLVSLGGGTAWADPKTFIGLVTTWNRNAGTTKTLIPKTITLSTSSIATIVVPTNTFYITNLAISANATVRVSIKSGVTYLTGNASIGMTLNPGGGWVETGSPDSPSYVGLAGAAAIVLEKFDMTGTAANVAGKLIYFDE